jgi:hypothetical protein
MGSLTKVFGGREGLWNGWLAGGCRGDRGAICVCATWPLPSAGQATPLSQSRPGGRGHASGKRSWAVVVSSTIFDSRDRNAGSKNGDISTWAEGDISIWALHVKTLIGEITSPRPLCRARLLPLWVHRGRDDLGLSLAGLARVQVLRVVPGGGF